VLLLDHHGLLPDLIILPGNLDDDALDAMLGMIMIQMQ
jgi:hypothetical protein